jgi:hypothetical protein
MSFQVPLAAELVELRQPPHGGYVGELERRLLPTFSATRFEPEVVSVSFSATRRRLPLAYW